MRYKLKEVCDFYAGTGFPVKYQGKSSGELPFYKVGDISGNIAKGYMILRDCNNYISRQEAGTIKGTIVPPNTVVFAKIGEALKLNRRALTAVDCLIDNNAMGICPGQKLNIKFFFYFMLQLKIEKLAESTTVPSVRKSRLENVEIKIPSDKEQTEIVAILDETYKLIADRKQQLTALDTLIKARFVEMFGDFKINPKGWPVVAFTEIATIDGNMTTDYKRYADYPHIGIDSIEKDTGVLKGYRTVKEDGVISGKYIFTPEHIIYSKIRPNLNKVALPDFDGVCSADAYPILPIEGKCNRVFLAYDMRSQFFLDYILQFCDRTNLPKVNRKEVSGFRTPLPPIELQKQFAAFVAQVDKSKAVVQQALDEAQVLFDSLMQEYFG